MVLLGQILAISSIPALVGQLSGTLPLGNSSNSFLGPPGLLEPPEFPQHLFLFHCLGLFNSLCSVYHLLGSVL